MTAHTPLTKNIFSNSQYGIDPEYFAGRADFVTELGKTINSDEKITAWLIVGKFGYGKTSLMTVFIEEMKSKEHSKKMLVPVTFDGNDKDIISLEIKAPNEIFYQIVLGKIYKEFLQQKLLRKISRYRIKHFLKGLFSRVPSVGVGPVEIDTTMDNKPGDIDKFIIRLNRLLRATKRPVDAIFIFFDDLNKYNKEEGGYELCANFCRELAQPRHVVDNASHTTGIRVIMFSPRRLSDEEADQRITYDLDKDLFELHKIDIKDYLTEKLLVHGYSHADIEKLAAYLYFYSGGVPLLFQNIGFDSCKSCIGSKEKLSERHIKLAVHEGKETTKQTAKLINETRSKILPFISSECDAEIIKKISALNIFDAQIMSSPIVKSKSDWCDEFCRAVPFPDDVKEPAFDKIWAALEHERIVIREETKFRFASEIHRTALKRALL